MSATANRRIGVLVGASDPIVEHDLQRFLPSHISFHIGRLDMPPEPKLAAAESSQMMCDSAPKAARKVALAEVEHFLFACTSASFFKGEGWDAEVARTIEEATGVPAMTAATAVADAIEAFGAKRVFLATPYSPEVNAKEISFLGYRSIDVVGQFSFGCRLSRDVPFVTPETIYDELIGRRKEIAQADALFISCTMLRAMEIAVSLETELALPLVTSNTASVWAMLRAIGEDTSKVEAGGLFQLP